MMLQQILIPMIFECFAAYNRAFCYHVQPLKTPILAPLTSAVASSQNRLVITARSGYNSVISTVEQRFAEAPM
jgi:hypothetical protein